jgi:anti-anti-sigma factor
MYETTSREVFRFDLERDGDRVIVALRGELDIANARRLREAFGALGDGPEPRVVVDLAGVPFIDSTCLAVLLWASNRCREQGREMLLREPTRGVVSALAASGLLRAFRYDPDSLDGVQPWPTRIPAAGSARRRIPQVVRLAPSRT